MENLKGKFGRRITLISLAVLALAVSVAIAISFSVSAKAEPNGPDGDDANVFITNQFMLSRIVHGPDDLSVTGSFTFTFYKDSYNGTPATGQDDTHMPAIGDNLNGEVNIPLNITAGAVSGENVKRNGPGIITTESATVEGNQDASDLVATWADKPSARAYIAQKRMSEFTNNPDNVTWSSYGDGIYMYRIVETGQTGYTTDDASKASYTLTILVKNSESTTELQMVLTQQNIDDGRQVSVGKKDPRKNYGLSNATAMTTEQSGDWEDIPYYRGFTFTSNRLGNPETFYVEKKVTGGPESLYPDLPFDFAIMFWNDGWDAGHSFYGVLVKDTDGTTTSIGAYQFVVKEEHEGDNTLMVALPIQNFIPIQHNTRLVFDGETTYSDGDETYTASKIPAGTPYIYAEDLNPYSVLGPQSFSETYTATTDTSAHSDMIDDEHVLYVVHSSFKNAIEVPEWIPVNDNAIVASPTQPGYENKSIITNHFDMQITGLFVDALPYVMLIGIPIAALIVWIVMRRRKLNVSKK